MKVYFDNNIEYDENYSFLDYLTNEELDEYENHSFLDYMTDEELNEYEHQLLNELNKL